MMYSLLITEEALADMEEIYSYIFNVTKDKTIALKVYDRIADSIETLSYFPKRFKKLELNLKEKTLRELTIKHYSIIYKVDNESVIVLRVLYSSSSIRRCLKGT